MPTKIYVNGNHQIIEKGGNITPFSTKDLTFGLPSNDKITIIDKFTQTIVAEEIFSDFQNANGSQKFTTKQEAIDYFSAFSTGGGNGTGVTIDLPSRIYKYTANTYADLLLLTPTPVEFDIARVYTSTGVWAINRKNAGAYTYLSGAWIYGSESLQTEILANDADILDLQINKATNSYVDAQDLKSVNAEGLFIQVSTTDVGITYTGSSTRTLTTMPKFFSLKIINTTLYTDNSTINIGFGAKLLRDANGDAIDNNNNIEDRFYNCYYDDLTNIIRVLNFTNVNAIQSAVISGNNYIVSKTFNRFPREISVRFSATNTTVNPQLQIQNGISSPLFYDLVNQNGLALTASVFVVGRTYNCKFNTVTSKYEVQGTGIASSTVALTLIDSWSPINVAGNTSVDSFTTSYPSGGTIAYKNSIYATISTGATLKSSASAGSGVYKYSQGKIILNQNVDPVKRRYIFGVGSINADLETFIGLSDSLTSLVASANHIGITILTNTLSFSCKAGGVQFTFGTPYVVNTTTLYALDIDIISTTNVTITLYNAQTSAVLYTATITNNIPSGSGQSMFESIRAINNLGTGITEIVTFYRMWTGTIAGFNKLG